MKIHDFNHGSPFTICSMTIYVVKIGGHLNIFATLLAVQSTDPLFIDIDRRSPELPIQIQVLRYMYILVSGIVMQYIAIVL